MRGIFVAMIVFAALAGCATTAPVWQAYQLIYTPPN